MNVMLSAAPEVSGKPFKADHGVVVTCTTDNAPLVNPFSQVAIDVSGPGNFEFHTLAPNAASLTAGFVPPTQGAYQINGHVVAGTQVNAPSIRIDVAP